MGIIPEPEGVDFVVVPDDVDAEAIRATEEWARRDRERPEHAAILKEAEQVIRALGIELGADRGDGEGSLEQCRQRVPNSSSEPRGREKVQVSPATRS